jgi:hypothetical protein
MSTAGATDRKEIVHRELQWHEETDHRRSRLTAALYEPPAFDAVVSEGLDSL